MVKHNNAVPHIHLHKHWNPNASQKGNIKVWLDQPLRKAARRRRRVMKAKKAFPRPLRTLRPQVNCPTVRYNMKRRLGRGFTKEELKAVNITPRYARTIGIRVDLRRRNLSEEGLSANVQRLKQYLSKLILFPLNRKKIHEGDATEEQQKNATQDRSRFGSGAVPLPRVSRAIEAPRKLTDEEKKKKVYKFLKSSHSAVRFMGERIVRARKKAEKEAKAAKPAKIK